MSPGTHAHTHAHTPARTHLSADTPALRPRSRPSSPGFHPDVAQHHLTLVPAGAPSDVAAAALLSDWPEPRQPQPRPGVPPPPLQRDHPQRPPRHVQRHPPGVRLRGLLRIQRLPLQVLGAGGLQLHPQHHLGLTLLHHQQGRQGQSSPGLPPRPPPRRDRDPHSEGVPLRHVPQVPLLNRGAAVGK